MCNPFCVAMRINAFTASSNVIPPFAFDTGRYDDFEITGTSYCLPVFESYTTLLETSKVTTCDVGSSMASINSSNVLLGLLNTNSDGFFTLKCFKILSVLHFFPSALSKFNAEPHFLVALFGFMCSASDLFPRLSFSAERNWFEANANKETITTTKITFHIGGDLLLPLLLLLLSPSLIDDKIPLFFLFGSFSCSFIVSICACFSFKMFRKSEGWTGLFDDESISLSLSLSSFFLLVAYYLSPFVQRRRLSFSSPPRLCVFVCVMYVYHSLSAR